ncbi:TetR/AcrR family transcriptional regulator C-terminal domain-containing protein [Actinoallomurus sp. NPDC052274]|uniref:TetR/AcrR family transcriptional regulator C-terminal domain-containing protein n=1 Tax=Actinoallomurus sp. NPDC052274 TaxID=3155420 RepID=UPI003419BBE0
MALRREVVVSTALRLLNEVGIDGLSTRRLARELGVQSPALYWHVKSKRELLDLMAEAMMAEALPAGRRPAPHDWTIWLAEDAHAKRRALLAYRDGARVHAGTLPTHNELPAVEAQVRALREAGFHPREALRLLLAIDRFVMGWVSEEQAWLQDAREHAQSPFPDEILEGLPLLTQAADVLRMQDRDADFEYGLQVLIQGFERRLGMNTHDVNRKGDPSDPPP